MFAHCKQLIWCILRAFILTSACPYVRGRTCKNIYIYSNREPETTTTQAVPSLSRARTCVAVHANQKKIAPQSGRNPSAP